jgi:hypothetical protein
MTTIIVSGAVANKHGNGGEAWVRLSYVLGLRQLGFDVYFVEQIDRPSCVGPTGAVVPFDDSVNLAFFRSVAERFGLVGSSALVYDDGARVQVHGLSMAELIDVADAADLLINVTGHLTLEPLLRRIRRKAYIDIDPGYTQFWHDGGQPGARLAGHDLYFTIGENIGTDASAIPTGGIAWRHTRPPVVLDHWPVSDEGLPDRFTTVASWRGPYGRVEYGGKSFGLKAHEFRKFAELPCRASQDFEIALAIHPADEKDRSMLQGCGWQITDPSAVAADPDAFRHYVQSSGGECSVAQGIYVETESGWFSDRTVRYLASGKPALVQDTGFRHIYPTGEGLVLFRTLDEAVAGAESIARDYDGHCQAARAIAESYFDSAKVLGRLLDEAGVAS